MRTPKHQLTLTAALTHTLFLLWKHYIYIFQKKEKVRTFSEDIFMGLIVLRAGHWDENVTQQSCQNKTDDDAKRTVSKTSMHVLKRK